MLARLGCPAAPVAKTPSAKSARVQPSEARGASCVHTCARAPAMFQRQTQRGDGRGIGSKSSTTSFAALCQLNFRDPGACRQSFSSADTKICAVCAGVRGLHRTGANHSTGRPACTPSFTRRVYRSADALTRASCLVLCDALRACAITRASCKSP